MSQATVGRRYATALIELAEAGNSTTQVSKALKALGDAWSASPELRAAFDNPNVDKAGRGKVLQQLFTKTMAPPVLQNTLKLLNDRGRMRVLPDLANAFSELSQEATGRVDAEVTTASPMPEKFYIDLQKTLEKVIGKKVVIVKKQDPEIIAGVVTRVGDKVFDGSVRNRLTEIKEQLLAH